MICARCLEEFDPTSDPGALVISPPPFLGQGCGRSSVEKIHICTLCWITLNAFIKFGLWKKEPRGKAKQKKKVCPCCTSKRKLKNCKCPEWCNP